MKNVKYKGLGMALVAGAVIALAATMFPVKAQVAAYYQPNRVAVSGTAPVPASIATTVTTNVDVNIPVAGKDLWFAFYGQNTANVTNTVVITLYRTPFGTSAGSTNIETVPMVTLTYLLTNTTQNIWCTNFTTTVIGGVPNVRLYSVGCTGGTLTNFGFFAISK